MGRRSPEEVAADKHRALELAATEDTIRGIADRLAISEKTLELWRKQDGNFRGRFERARNRYKAEVARVRNAGEVFDPDRPKPDMPPFVEARRKYFGRPTPEHQLGFVTAWEDQTNLKVVWLAPTGAGKDTTCGDLATLEAVRDWSNRVAWIMASADFANRRVGERIEPALTDPAYYKKAPDGPNTSIPYGSLIDDYGPFVVPKGRQLVYPNGDPVPKSTWTKGTGGAKLYFLREEGEREADPNLAAGSMYSQIYGARIRRLFCSDPFTYENQRSPTERAKQLALFSPNGTIGTRLDGSGRETYIGSRLGSWDNWGVWLKAWTAHARIIHQCGYKVPCDRDHPFFRNTMYTKFSNGVALVVTSAIVLNADGDEETFWPQNPEFQLDGYLHHEDSRHTVDDLEDDDYMALVEAGAVRVRGLRERRDNPEDDDDRRFEVTQNQNVRADDDLLDFTDLLLNHCDDPTLSIGQWRHDETLILGVDPATAGGAAWVLLALDHESGATRLVDCHYAEGVGSQGLRQDFVVGPVTEFMPRYFCYEVNRESGELDHPDVQAALREARCELVRHSTGTNRSLGEASVASMAFDMRDGLIRFPAFPGQPREELAKIRKVKDHFKAWDSGRVEERTVSGGFGHAPDDLCMAFWIAWVKAKELRTKRFRARGGVPQRKVPLSVQRRWENRTGVEDRTTLRHDNSLDHLMEVIR